MEVYRSNGSLLQKSHLDYFLRGEGRRMKTKRMGKAKGQGRERGRGERETDIGLSVYGSPETAIWSTFQRRHRMASKRMSWETKEKRHHGARSERGLNV